MEKICNPACAHTSSNQGETGLHRQGCVCMLAGLDNTALTAPFCSACWPQECCSTDLVQSRNFLLPREVEAHGYELHVHGRVKCQHSQHAGVFGVRPLQAHHSPSRLACCCIEQLHFAHCGLFMRPGHELGQQMMPACLVLLCYSIAYYHTTILQMGQCAAQLVQRR
jgi:hypothetical protein